jgi:CBS domain containing-hemolysin-like protein
VALRELQTQRQQLALVVSEHDRDILAVEHQPDGSMLLPGTFPLHDLEDLGIDTPAHRRSPPSAG